MRINTFFYSIKQGIKNIGRNKMFSLASIATMAACIFMFGIFYILVMNFNAMIQTAEQSVAVVVYFNEDATEDQIEEVGTEIGKRTEVANYEYVSGEDAWNYVKDVYFDGREDLAAAFEGDNPVEKSMHYNIYLSDVSMQDALVTYLKTLDGVREVKESEKVADVLTGFNRLVSFISAGIILILFFVAVFLISNTVSVGISVRKEEIAIMKLIGATDFMVRFPFMIEGIIIGLVGAALPTALLYYLYDYMMAYMAEKFSFLNTVFTFISAPEIFRVLIPVALILGVGIGFLGSRFTIRKHLKV